MGIPKSRAARSTSWTVAPSPRAHPASFMYGARIRFTRKPGPSPTTTGTFPRVRARAYTVATASSEVAEPRITSTRGILCTGLKKCIPQNCSGRFRSRAIPSTDREDVLVARMHRSGTCDSASARTARFTSIFSTMASTTRSAAAKPA